jgi:hypothetical protein
MTHLVTNGNMTGGRTNCPNSPGRLVDVLFSAITVCARLIILMKHERENNLEMKVHNPNEFTFALNRDPFLFCIQYLWRSRSELLK